MRVYVPLLSHLRLGITNRGHLRRKVHASTYILTWPCVSTLRDIKMLRDYLNVRDLRVLVYFLNLWSGYKMIKNNPL